MNQQGFHYTCTCTSSWKDLHVGCDIQYTQLGENFLDIGIIKFVCEIIIEEPFLN